MGDGLKPGKIFPVYADFRKGTMIENIYLQIGKAKNGYVAILDSETYVFVTPKALADWFVVRETKDKLDGKK